MQEQSKVKSNSDDEIPGAPTGQTVELGAGDERLRKAIARACRALTGILETRLRRRSSVALDGLPRILGPGVVEWHASRRVGGDHRGHWPRHPPRLSGNPRVRALLDQRRCGRA